ncbi:hypothetical protein Golob_013247, partial [Gossypium lobatum]|nr:hypothetical protein [Gossypium lobatum]
MCTKLIWLSPSTWPVTTSPWSICITSLMFSTCWGSSTKKLF